MKNYKLSSKMVVALSLLAQYGEFHACSKGNWDAWENTGTEDHIRPDTMSALVQRGLVKLRWNCRHIASITEVGELLNELIKAQEIIRVKGAI